MVPPSSHRVPRVRRYSGSNRPLPSFAYETLTLFGMLSHTFRLNFRVPLIVRTPQTLLLAVWPLSLSLATTQEISVDVFSSPYLDVSVQAVPFLTLFGSRKDTQACPCVGFPIRISTDQCVFAAPRGFSQLIASFIGSWCQGIPLVLFLA